MEKHLGHITLWNFSSYLWTYGMICDTVWYAWSVFFLISFKQPLDPRVVGSSIWVELMPNLVPWRSAEKAKQPRLRAMLQHTHLLPLWGGHWSHHTCLMMHRWAYHQKCKTTIICYSESLYFAFQQSARIKFIHRNVLSEGLESQLFCTLHDGDGL